MCTTHSAAASTCGEIHQLSTFSNWIRTRVVSIETVSRCCLLVSIWAPVYRLEFQLLIRTASGDIRHVVKTIADLPEDGSRRIDVTVNAREFNVVARNTVLLLLAVSQQANNTTNKRTAVSETAEALIHLWYSASIPAGVLALLQGEVKPLIEEVCSKIANKPSDIVLAKTWEFSPGRSLRLTLMKKQ